MLETVSSFLTTLIILASFWNFLAISMIGLGIVAEKRTVCLSSGVSVRIVSISSRNPISSISSASSNITIDTESNLTVFLLIWSITRPGVPTIICTPDFKDLICLTISCPPYTGNTLMSLMYLASFLISSATCTASSLVGQSTIACGFLTSGLIFCNIGIEYAAVLPVPVCACPITSIPSNTAGMACVCIGDVSSKPISSTALKILSSIFNSSNFIL